MLLWGMSKFADLPRVLKIIDGTGQHYKFRNKNVTEVSQDRSNCLNELRSLENNACLPGTYNSGMVVHQVTTELVQF
jgi:hypothetical protein